MGDDGALDPRRCVLHSNFTPGEGKDPSVTALTGQRVHGCDACLRPVMLNYIRDIDVFRQNAAIAMGNSGDASYLPALRRAASEGSDQVRRFAEMAICKLEAAPAEDGVNG